MVEQTVAVDNLELSLAPKGIRHIQINLSRTNAGITSPQGLNAFPAGIHGAHRTTPIEIKAGVVAGAAADFEYRASFERQSKASQMA